MHFASVSVDANSNVRGLHVHVCTIRVLRSSFVHTLCKSRFKAVLAILRFTSYDLHEEGADGGCWDGSVESTGSVTLMKRLPTPS